MLYFYTIKIIAFPLMISSDESNLNNNIHDFNHLHGLPAWPDQNRRQ